MALLFARERWQDVFVEMFPLLKEHYHEIAWRKDEIPLSINYDRYCTLSDEGMLLCFTARSGRRLVGYSLYFLMPHLHYSETKMAINDVLFLEPTYRNRGLGADLINYCEREAKALGAQVITLHVKPQLDFGPLCKELGYEMGDRIWQKWLGKEE